MKNSLLVLFLILISLFIACVVLTILLICKKDRRMLICTITIPVYVVTLFTFVISCMCYREYDKQHDNLISVIPDESTTAEIPETEPTTVATIPTEPQPTFTAYYDENSDPANWNIAWSVVENGQIHENFQRDALISFPDAAYYNAANGVLTHLGNNFRTGTTITIGEYATESVRIVWPHDFAAIDSYKIVGQPLIVQWKQSIRQKMNLKDEKKIKSELSEIICFTEDGTILFYDLEDGTPTREPINTGLKLDGKASLDPRGYPLLYIGSSNVSSGKAPSMNIISLIDGQTLYSQSGVDPDANRKWYALNYAPLVCSDSDTLIWPCASGILYTIKLNTTFNEASGKITVRPDNIVKLICKIDTQQSSGWDCDPVIVNNYLYITDRSGLILCIDLNTMNVIWAQDMKGRRLATPVFTWDSEDRGYLYTSSQSSTGKCYIQKIDASNGNIVWEKEPEGISPTEAAAKQCISSAHIGKEKTVLEDVVIYSITDSADSEKSKLLAVNTRDGNTIWEIETENCLPESLNIFYGDSGNAYMLVGSRSGKIHLYSMETRNILTELSVDSVSFRTVTIFQSSALLTDDSYSLYCLSLG